MGRSSWVVLLGPECRGTCPCPAEAEDIDTDRKRRQWDHTGRNWSDGVTSQGMPAASRSCKKQWTDSPLEALGGVRPCLHLDFVPVILTLVFWPPDL